MSPRRRYRQSSRLAPPSSTSRRRSASSPVVRKGQMCESRQTVLTRCRQRRSQPSEHLPTGRCRVNVTCGVNKAKRNVSQARRPADWSEVRVPALLTQGRQTRSRWAAASGMGRERVSDEGGDAAEPAESRFHASLGPPFRRLATASCLRSAAPGSTLSRNNRRCALGKQPPPDTADRGSHSPPWSSRRRPAAPQHHSPSHLPT